MKSGSFYLDFSGSVTVEEMKDYYAQIKIMCAHYHIDKIKVVSFNHTIFNVLDTEYYDFKPNDIQIPSTFGGTDYRACYEHFQKNPSDMMFMHSDGMGYGKKDSNVKPHFVMTNPDEHFFKNKSVERIVGYYVVS